MIHQSEEKTVVEDLRALLLRNLSIHVDSDADDLLASGLLDSLNLVRLISHVEKQFAVELPISDVGIESFRSIAAIAELIEHRRRSEAPGGKATRESGRIDVIEDLQDLLEQKLSLIVGDPSTDLFQTGQLDSMLLVQLILELETHFGLLLPIEELDVASFRSLSSIAELIVQREALKLGRFGR
jgi:acyl carrier protein